LAIVELLLVTAGALGFLTFTHCYCESSSFHLAVITLAAQPAEKSPFEQLGVETVGLRSPMLARHRHARGVNDVGLNAARVSFPKNPRADSCHEAGSGRFDASASIMS
jgi:hypothetical protein